MSNTTPTRITIPTWWPDIGIPADPHVILRATSAERDGNAYKVSISDIMGHCAPFTVVVDVLSPTPVMHAAYLALGLY